MNNKKTPQNTRRARLLSCVVIALCLQNTAQGFNSEEHKLIGDIGASRITIPPAVALPGKVALKTINPQDYLNFLKDAKELAVGFRSNDVSEYDASKGGVQDNCYYHAYMQLESNKKIHIPELADIPNRNLTVKAKAGKNNYDFTFGELVAFYGDYRRTVKCNKYADCFLTDAKINKINFNRGNVLNTSFYCPSPINSATYLRYIASGLEPPMGSLGNGISNSANDNEYAEASWWGDEVMRLVNANDWHFATVGNAYYVGLHRVALYYAQKAISSPKYWNVALHYEANALHSLTDFFAFGHVATNRDRTSYGILSEKGLLGKTAVKWQQHAINLGGGQRLADHTVILQSNLPPITAPVEIRNDFLKSYQGTWARYSQFEHLYHDYFNGQTDKKPNSGAMVRNLNGDLFRLYGDSRLHLLTDADREPIYNAVTASIQSLFDAQVAMRNGYPMAEIGKPGSSFFKALQYIPIYIQSDLDNYFKGKWVQSAKALDEIAGAGLLDADSANCQIPYLWGADLLWPTKSTSLCDTFTGYHSVPFEAKSNWLNSGGQNATAKGNRRYKFTVNASTDIDITLDAILADSFIYLLNAQGAIIATNDDGAGGIDARLLTTIPAGNYTVVAATAQAGQSDAFTLTVKTAVSTAHANTKISAVAADEVMVTLRDKNGNPVPNHPVKFFIHRGRATLTTPEGNTDENGAIRTKVTNALDIEVDIGALFDENGDPYPETPVVRGSPVTLTFAIGG